MTKPDPGIYDNIPFSEYLAIPYFSKSDVRPILKSPKHYKYEKDHPELAKQSARMDFGSLVDCLILEPDEFPKRFLTLPDTYQNSKKQIVPFTLHSKTCRKVVEDAKKAGIIPITIKQNTNARLIGLAIQNHRTAQTWLKGRKQITIIWKDPETGVMCKGRIDIQLEDRLVDLKVTDDPSGGAFSRTATKMLYHVQAAAYLMGLYCADTGKYPEEWTLPFSFIAAEANPPYDVVTYDMDQESLDAGRAVFNSAIQLYADCMETDKWPGISDFAEPLTIQQWAIHRILYEGSNDI